MMKFGRVETSIDLGDFDFAITGTTGNLRFVPAKSKFNNYSLRIFAIETFKNTVAAQGDIGTEINVGVGVSVISSSTGIGSTDPSPVQVVGFGTTAKKEQENSANDKTIMNRNGLFSVSKKIIEDEIGKSIISFAYPYAYPQQKKDFVCRFSEILSDSGFSTCVTTKIGISKLGDNPLELKRVPVNSADDDKLLLAKLRGSYDWMGKLQNIKKSLSNN